MKTKKHLNTEIVGLIRGAAAGALFFLAASLIIALVLTKSDLSYRTVKYAGFAITAAAGFIAGFTGKRGARCKGILAGAVSSAITAVLIVAAILAVNSFSCSQEVFLLLPSGLLPGMLGGILSSNLG